MSTVDSIATIPKYINLTLQPEKLESYELSSSDTIGERIKKLRMNKNLKPKQLGDLINITGSGIANYENGTARPSRKVLINLFNVLGEEVLCDSYSKFIIKDYGNLMKKWREKNKFKIYEAIKILGVSENTYIDWEKQRAVISRRMYYKLIHFFNEIDA
ncbi:helix-turn-helix transcriptional regulator [Tepidibacter hydrothermalis]|uniref:Helix-turn-helix transcriptional regulator n=1 Tax=Tepidibacter hydrothermalis TaxID=3036126 RepID=A0ABY8EHJ8_9FIRM|nr:helix-turn-helix transcriptional regulator [Tepidibacter hydrothermalis]WFD12437.1 helix-turn-helix transcriptional regulator [Tepidibacter hydrothermalis]